MRLPNGSASALHRTRECAAWLVLPHASETSDYADRGHELHDFIAAVLTGTPVETALYKLQDGRAHEFDQLVATARRIDWRALVGDLEPESIEVESAFAVDVRARSARRLGSNVGRDYARAAKRAGRKLGAHEVPGALDISGRRRVDRVRVVRDVKTGYVDVEPPASNPQLLFFGAAYVLLEDLDQVVLEVAKLRPDGSIWYGREGSAVVTPLEVDRFLDEVEAALERVREARKPVRRRLYPEVHAGPWCQYCPAAPACPAKALLARSMLGEVTEIRAKLVAMTPEERGRAWSIAKELEPLLEEVLKALKAMIVAEPVPLPSGKIARAVHYEQERVDQAALVALARELGATDEQLASCRCTRPVTQVRVVNGPRLRRGRAA